MSRIGPATRGGLMRSPDEMKALIVLEQKRRADMFAKDNITAPQQAGRLRWVRESSFARDKPPR